MKICYDLDEDTLNHILKLSRIFKDLNLSDITFSYLPSPNSKYYLDFSLLENRFGWQLIVYREGYDETGKDIYSIINNKMIYVSSEK